MPGQRTCPEVQKAFKWWKTTVWQWKEKTCMPETKAIHFNRWRPMNKIEREQHRWLHSHQLKIIDFIKTSFLLCVRHTMRMRIPSKPREYREDCEPGQHTIRKLGNPIPQSSWPHYVHWNVVKNCPHTPTVTPFQLHLTTRMNLFPLCLIPFCLILQWHVSSVVHGC